MHFLVNSGSFSVIFEKVGVGKAKHPLCYKNGEFNWIWKIQGKFRNLGIREYVFFMDNMQK